jgi:hypothetical protein
MICARDCRARRGDAEGTGVGEQAVTTRPHVVARRMRGYLRELRIRQWQIRAESLNATSLSLLDTLCRGDTTCISLNRDMRFISNVQVLLQHLHYFDARIFRSRFPFHALIELCDGFVSAPLKFLAVVAVAEPHRIFGHVYQTDFCG